MACIGTEASEQATDLPRRTLVGARYLSYCRLEDRLAVSVVLGIERDYPAVEPVSHEALFFLKEGRPILVQNRQQLRALRHDLRALFGQSHRYLRQ